MSSDNVEYAGPKVRVHVQYICNGCMHHKLDTDPESPHPHKKYHACHHPSVIKDFGMPQWICGNGNPDLTIYHEVQTPTYLCPHIDESAIA